MRTVYLVRHGEVAFAAEPRCIGRTDIPLSPRGERQAQQLAAWFAARPLEAVYASPAWRTRATAEALAAGRCPVQLREALWELDMGEWDGMPFTEIRARYPELHALRGQDPEAYSPPGGERLSEGQARIRAALHDILAESAGDIALVAHAGVLRLLLCGLRSLPLHEWRSIPQPNGCVSVLRIDGDHIEVAETGRKPVDAPDEAECLHLLAARRTPAPAVAHCRAVAARAVAIAASLNRQGAELDLPLVRAAALLHDIARARPDHARTGADWLAAEGYPLVASMVAAHHDLLEPVRLDEAAVVFLADKLTDGTRPVELEARFAASRARCHTPEALHAHDARLRQALRIQELVLTAGGEL